MDQKKTKSLVGIVSFNIYSNHLNYGTALHSWAFQQYLKKQDTPSIILNYIPRNLEYYSMKYPILNDWHFWHPIRFIKMLLNWSVGFSSNIRKYNKFQHFFDTQYVKTTFAYNNKQLQKMHDIEEHNIGKWVCESDVIWKVSKVGSFDDIFFLNFPAAEGKSKIAYAPCMSTRRFTPNEVKTFLHYTEDYTAISARERKSADYLSELTGTDVKMVLDPTLLLTEDDYSSIIKRPAEEGYILLYNCMVNDQKMVKEAEKYANDRGKNLIEVSNWSINKVINHHKVVTDAGIEEFLGFIKNASEVITNSFHGFCFSIIFQKPMFLFERNKADYKMENISNITGLSSRLVPCDKKMIPSNCDTIDFNMVYKRLESIKKLSYSFIDGYISCIN